MNFRNEILDAVRDCLYELEIHSDVPDPGRPGFHYPKRQTPNPTLVRTNPNPDCDTPLWQILLRPIRPQDVGQTHLIPSVFLRAAGGFRSASGRNLQDSPRLGVVGDLSEDYQIDVIGVFRDGYGQAGADGKALALSLQVNNFIHDLDKCLNVNNLRASLDCDINVTDAYIARWETIPDNEGSNDDIVVANLIVQINFLRVG